MQQQARVTQQCRLRKGSSLPLVWSQWEAGPEVSMRAPRLVEALSRKKVIGAWWAPAK